MNKSFSVFSNFLKIYFTTIHYYKKPLYLRAIFGLCTTIKSVNTCSWQCSVQFLSIFLSVVSITVTSISCHSSCCRQSTGKWHKPTSDIQFIPDQRHVCTQSVRKAPFDLKYYLVNEISTGRSTAKYLRPLFPNRIGLFLIVFSSNSWQAYVSHALNYLHVHCKSDTTNFQEKGKFL